MQKDTFTCRECGRIHGFRLVLEGKIILNVAIPCHGTREEPPGTIEFLSAAHDRDTERDALIRTMQDMERELRASVLVLYDKILES